MKNVFNKETVKTLSKGVEILDKHGPDSPEIQEFIEKNHANTRVVELLDTAIWLKKKLNDDPHFLNNCQPVFWSRLLLLIIGLSFVAAIIYLYMKC